MTGCARYTLLASLALAILILPSAALGAGIYPDEDPAEAYFLSFSETQPYPEDCSSPVAHDSMVMITENTPVGIVLNATDPDGDPLTYHIVSDPVQGTLVFVSGNTVVYAPAKDYWGTDSFSFRAHDGNEESNTATVTITIGPPCSLQLFHGFYGNVTINGEPAAESTIIRAECPGASSDITGNPVTIRMNGVYGLPDDPAQQLIVHGCIRDGVPITFFVDSVQAEVTDVTTGSPWQSSYPFTAGEVTNLDIRVSSPGSHPDTVYIDSLSLTISNTSLGFFKRVKLERDPSIEARVTPGIFNIRISATGVHGFYGLPVIGRVATFGMYESGRPVVPERSIWFGSNAVRYDYLATETRTFDILIFVNENPELHDVKHVTISTTSS